MNELTGKRTKPKVTAIIQARMQSKRLPKKMIRKLAGKPLISHVIERAQCIEGIETVVLATSTNDDDKELIKIARSMDCETFAGPLENVLERYYLVAEKFECDYIVRITGDNPFTDVDYGSMAVDIALESGSDLCSLSNLPLGTALEIIKRDALVESYHDSKKPYHCEHVTPYIKEHPERFQIERFNVSLENPFPRLRLTVDTEDDYKLAALIYQDLYQGKPFPITEVIGHLKRNPDLVTINETVKQRPMTHSENENA